MGQLLTSEDNDHLYLIEGRLDAEAADWLESILKKYNAHVETSEKLTKALTSYVYETTHLSPERADGSHECVIPKATLEAGRDALRAAGVIV